MVTEKIRAGLVCIGLEGELNELGEQFRKEAAAVLSSPVPLIS